MTHRSWRARGRDAGLLFCSAVGIYLVSLVLARLLAVPLVKALGDSESTWLRLLLGVLCLDLSRAPALLLAAWIVGPSLGARPWVSATALVLLSYLFEGGVSLVLGQSAWLFGPTAVWLLRAGAAALLAWLAQRVLARRRRGS